MPQRTTNYGLLCRPQEDQTDKEKKKEKASGFFTYGVMSQFWSLTIFLTQSTNYVMLSASPRLKRHKQS